MKFDYKKIVDEVFSKNFWSRFVVMTIAVFILAVNYNMFLLHNNLVIGGTSGLATIVHEYTHIQPATFIMTFNIFFIIISFFLLGPKSTGQTIIGSLMYPFFVSLTGDMCETLANKLVFNEFIIIVIISGILFGTANGFIYKTGFSTGGADILIQIINKFFKIPTGHASFIINMAVICGGAVTFGIPKAIYAIIVIFINSNLVDKIMLGISNSKVFYIHTKKAENIIKFIKNLDTGYTIMKTEGGQSKNTNDMIMCVIPTSDYYMFKNVIQGIDPNAFFVISDCYEVYGGKKREKFPFI